MILQQLSLLLIQETWAVSIEKILTLLLIFAFAISGDTIIQPLSSEEAIEIELSDWLINQNDVICKQTKDPIVTKSALAYSFMNYFFIKF